MLARIQDEYIALEEHTRRRVYFMEKRTYYNEGNPNNITRAALFIFFMRTCYNGIYSVNHSGKLSVTFGAGGRVKLLEEELIRFNHKLLQDVVILDGDYRQTAEYTGRHATVEELVEIDGIGEVLAQAWTAFFSDGKNNAIVDHLLAELTFEAGDEESSEGADEAFAGMNFVITGSLEQFKNRKELQELIERRGGKVTGSVTSKTNYLINNDVASSSSKNKKARELGVPILSEEEFLKL